MIYSEKKKIILLYIKVQILCLILNLSFFFNIDDGTDNTDNSDDAYFDDVYADVFEADKVNADDVDDNMVDNENDDMADEMKKIFFN